ncbi:myc protein [Asterias rubens]|uniref:myc protein n=1 Tax=Asterias rubens TaxID=7604 RepID=UPI001455208C|nr:myc protein [Asterias rubens]XP_033645051.1 myc protein [Asterias rubens]
MAAIAHRLVLTSDQIQVRDHRDHNYHRSSQSIPDDDMNSLEDSDSMESCFAGEEEFYSSTLTPPTPSEDIWKKFELYPTPPLSPSHNPDDKESDRHPRHHQQDGEADLLQEVTNILMDDDDLPWLTRKCHFSDPVFRTPSPISPALIQDCMWSSIIAEERRKLFMKSEKKHAEERATKKASTPSSGVMLPPLVPASEYGSSDCVDPSAVFPYPLSETRLDLFSSGTNTPSDSEEEIDVVTVEKKHHSVHKINTTRPYHKQSTKVRHQHHHRPISVALVGSKRGRPSTATILSIPIKKLKTEGNLEEVKQILQKSNLIRSSSGSSRGSSRGCSRNSSQPSSQPSSHPSSDSEDTEKRACHNVLERKRREDLRTSFLLLRDEVPELGTCDRAAKVVILKKATDYVSSLRDREETLRMDMATEKNRNLQLRRRLEALLAPLTL